MTVARFAELSRVPLHQEISVRLCLLLFVFASWISAGGCGSKTPPPPTAEEAAKAPPLAPPAKGSAQAMGDK